MDKYNEAIWRIVPQNTPAVIKHCSKCNKKMAFYCSEKFRLNSNQQRVDIWLIYKCTKCDTTWKLSLIRGIKPHDLTAQLFDKLTNNDKALAWKYAFDRNLLKQSGYEIDYSCVNYSVEGFNICAIERFVNVQLKSQYFFDLKLSTFLAKILGVSIGSIRKLVGENLITISLGCDIMRYKIRTDFYLHFELDCIFLEEP